MAKEWYLMTPNTRPNILGGYENEAFSDFKNDAFSEVLQTDMATTVLLSDSNLSDNKEIRCVIQGNTADTQTKSFERVGLFLPNTIKTGMYILYENNIWLITGRPGTNGIYEKAVMGLCQFKLCWQNYKGEIVKRWVCSEAYNKGYGGVQSNKSITIGDDQYRFLLPIDDETRQLQRDMRFPIDLNNSTQPDIYKIINRKIQLNDNQRFGHGGLISLTLSYDFFNNDTDKLVLLDDGNKVWIADYTLSSEPLPPIESEIHAIIKGNTSLKNGFERAYVVSFTNAEGNLVENCDFNWKIESAFEVLHTVVDDKTIKIKVNDENVIGCSFLLQVFVDSSLVSELKVNVVDVY